MADTMRSLNSFGVAGLLTKSCEIYYSNDLRARNMGRVSDLISAKLRETHADELKIRSLLIYGGFQAYALKGRVNHHDEEIPPCSVEVGIDSHFIAVSVSLHWEAEHQPRWNGIAERVSAGQAGDRFEELLAWAYRHSSQVIIRHEEKEKRVEIVSLVSRNDTEMRDPLLVVAVDSEKAPLLEVGSYTEIGDLNYSKLLRNPVQVGREGPSKVVETDKKEDNSEPIRIQGSSKESGSPAEFKIRSGLDPQTKEKIEGYELEISELKERVRELEGQLSGPPKGNRAANDDVIVVKEPQTEEKKDDWGFHFIKKVWPFTPKEEDTKSKEEEPAEASAEVEASEDREDAGEDTDRVETEETVVEGEDEIREPTAAEKEAQAALNALQELAKVKKSKKIEQTLNEIEEEVESNKAKKWVDSLSSELLQEKAKLNELQRNLSKQMRQRELEFKTAERALKQELKRKDEQLSQKQAAIENKNEQIAQLNLAVERATTSTGDKEVQQYKVKLDRTQRIAQMKEEEAKALATKIRDLENRLIIAQAKSNKGNELQHQTKIQGLEKKLEEYKRINQRLMDSLNAQKDRSNDKEVGDLRRKIDQLDRASAEFKKNLEKAQFRLKEVQESEKKLQMDLARALEENRSLRKNGGQRGGGESSSGGQAA